MRLLYFPPRIKRSHNSFSHTKEIANIIITQF